jgi:hypothetical protein
MRAVTAHETTHRSARRNRGRGDAKAEALDPLGLKAAASGAKRVSRP